MKGTAIITLRLNQYIGEWLLYFVNKMSKARNTRIGFSGPHSRSRIRSILQNHSKQHRFNTISQQESHVFDQTRCHTMESGHEQIRKDSVYNKNISYFRQSFRLNDTHMLPFLASLRTISPSTTKFKPIQTIVAPFEAERTTFNQKVKKSVNDMRANPFRLSKINYRWHNASGAGVKAGCQFECGLRLFKDVANPQQSSFNSTISPIRQMTVQPYRYRQNELICPRQKRIFTLQK